MYEPTRQFLTFCIAGFSHHEGYKVFDKLKVGTKLKLKSEPDNPYDSNAVAIYYKGTKLGYVPARINGAISQLVYFGHAGIFKCSVTQVNPDAHPEAQVRVTIDLVDAR